MIPHSSESQSPPERQPLLHSAGSASPSYDGLTSSSSSTLLNPPPIASAIEGTSIRREDNSNEDALAGGARHGEAYDNVPREKRQLGFLSTVFLIFNRIIGTGIYATPSAILRGSGSVGVALLLWLVGALVAATGTTVYMELGTGLPRSGGEKNYLEFIYRRPKFLVTCAYSIYALLLGAAAANSIVFGEYFIHALNLPPSTFNTRFIAFLCLVFCVLVHGCFLKLGIRLQNLLGIFKLVVLSAIAILGLFCLAGVPGFGVGEGYEKPRNFEWKYFWEGSGTGVNALMTALYSVMWSFVGYANANYALSEIKKPIKTIRVAAPVAVFSVACVYFLVNIAYFAVISKTDILDSKRIIAALFFRNLFGPTFEKGLSAVICLSVLGNLLAGQFAQGRVIQELGREGILPWPEFFSSNKPFGAPLAGLFTQFLVSCSIMLTPPAGDAYLFMISLSSYSLNLVNTLVSFGLLLLHTPAYRTWNWDPPYRAPKSLIILFFISNVFLVIVPLIPPAGTRVYEKLPHWSHPVVSILLSVLGVTYWYIWCVSLPKKNGYELKREWVLQDDGVSRFVFRKIFPSSPS